MLEVDRYQRLKPELQLIFPRFSRVKDVTGGILPKRVSLLIASGLVSWVGLVGCANDNFDSTPTQEATAITLELTPTSTTTSTPTLTPMPPPTLTPEATKIVETPVILVIPTPLAQSPETQPTERREAGWIYGKPVWSDYNWFPIGPDKAQREGLVTLEESLGKFDKLNKALRGEKSNFQLQYQIFAGEYIRKYPQTLEWAGFCHGLAHAEMLDPQPLIEPETFTVANGEKVTITYRDRLAFASALHSGDAMLKFSEDPEENLDILITGVIEQGQTFIVEAPAAGLPGLWYRVVAAVSPDRSRLYVTGFNRNNNLEVIYRNTVRDAYIPIPGTDIEAGRVPAGILKPVPSNWSFALPKPLVNRLNNGR